VVNRRTITGAGFVTAWLDGYGWRLGFEYIADSCSICTFLGKVWGFQDEEWAKKSASASRNGSVEIRAARRECAAQVLGYKKFFDTPVSFSPPRSYIFNRTTNQ